MSEPKGRSGKKPKYQIADIGGADLTSEDISTERVLNFLIKGEIGSVGETGSSSADSTTAATVAPSSSDVRSAVLPDTSELPDAGDQPLKKSLSHLFERAGSGGSSGPPDVYPRSQETDPTRVPLPAGTGHLIGAKEEVSGAQNTTATSRIEVNVPRSEQLIAVSTGVAPTSLTQPLTGSTHESQVPKASAAGSSDAGPDLVDLVDRWKNLYRLKSGEIAALSVLFRRSQDEGRSECYVKMHKLAEMSNLDYRYCQKVVRSLERLGWITKLQDYDATTQLGVLYRVNLRPAHLT